MLPSEHIRADTLKNHKIPKDKPSAFLTVLNVIVMGVTILGAGYTYNTYQHEYIASINGRFLRVMMGQIDLVDTGTKKIVHFTSIMPYVYLFNRSKSFAHIIDYDLKLQIGDQWIDAQALYDYGDNWSKFRFDRMPIDLAKDHIFMRGTSIVSTSPLHGWLPFLLRSEIDVDSIARYRLTLEDASGKVHIIDQNAKKEYISEPAFSFFLKFAPPKLFPSSNNFKSLPHTGSSSNGAGRVDNVNEN